MDGVFQAARENLKNPPKPLLETAIRQNRGAIAFYQEELASIGKARDLLATYRKHEDVITIGAYTKGSNAQVDQAIEKQPGLRELLRQPIEDKWTRDKSFAELKKLVA